MTTYTVEANTGSSIWPVTSYETTPEVEAYLRTQPQFTFQISPGNSGMYCAPRFADALVSLMGAQNVDPAEADIHAAAIRQVAHLVQLAAVHHGAALQWDQTGN